MIPLIMHRWFKQTTHKTKNILDFIFRCEIQDNNRRTIMKIEMTLDQTLIGLAGEVEMPVNQYELFGNSMVRSCYGDC